LPWSWVYGYRVLRERRRHGVIGGIDVRTSGICIS
jgi:hypothetical protein